MDAHASAILANARKTAGGMVAESDAKTVLAARGIPVTQGLLCDTEDAAVVAAESLGLPVVLKVSAPDILHKTEVGGVCANLQTTQAVREAYRGICASVRNARGTQEPFRILVDKMVSGHEFFLGATRSEFGPLILFGLGGIMAELFHEVAHCLAPLTDADARRLLRATRAEALFDGFRGTAGVSEEVMASLLVGASRFLEDHPEILELDMNPIIARGDMAQVADARFLVGDPKAAPPARVVAPAVLELLYAPRSVAVVGVTTGRYNRGRVWMRSVKIAGFKGPLYAVTRKEGIDDFPTFAFLADIPEVPDLVMIEVGRANVPEVLQQCVDRGVPWVAIRASGFGEDGTDEGHTLKTRLTEIVAGSGTHIIGPSALGPYAPVSGLVPDGAVREPGHVGFITQSGVAFLALARAAGERNFGISRAISFGSEVDVGVENHLRFLHRDPSTHLIACHVEGVRYPNAFAEALVAAGHDKPVLLMKGGRTALGARAVQSHSGAMTSPGNTWDALCDKAGALMVDDLDDLIDHITAFTHLQKAKGPRLAFITPSGGQGVLFADECHRHGLSMPPLDCATEEHLAAILSAGTSVHNPMDFAAEYFQPKVMTAALKKIAADPNIDTLVFHISIDLYAVTIRYADWVRDAFVEVLTTTSGAINGKPIVVLMPHLVDDALRAEVAQRLLLAGVLVMPTAPRLLRVLARHLFWNERFAARAGAA